MTESVGEAVLKPHVYTYHINLDERGSFYADVRNKSGKTVFEIKAGNELEDGETSIFDDGFMKDKNDIVGLQQYLRDLKVIEPTSIIKKSNGIDESHYEDVPRDSKGRVSLDDITYELKESKGVVTKIIAILRGKSSEVFTKLADRLVKLKALEEEIEKINEEVKQEAGREKIAALFGAEYEFSTRVVRTVNNLELVLSKQPKGAETTKWAEVYKELSEKLTPELLTVAEAIVKKHTTTQAPKPPSLKLEPAELKEGIMDLWSSFISKLKLWGKSFDTRMTKVEKNIGEYTHAPEMRVRSDEPTSPYNPDNVSEHYGDDDYEDEMRGYDTEYTTKKGTVAYTDKISRDTFEYDYVATVELYKGHLQNIEINDVVPTSGTPEYDSLTPDIQSTIDKMIKSDISNKF